MLMIIGIIFCVGGMTGFIASIRRGFYNTNQYGVEQARNFSSAMGTGCLRLVCLFAAFVGFCVAIGGLIGVLVG